MIKLFNLVKSFFYYLWSLINFTRILIINIIFILLISLFCYYIYNIHHQKNINDKMLKKKNQVLEINFNENLTDDSFYQKNKKIELFNKLIKKDNNSILNIVQAIKYAKQDKNVSGIILKLHNLNIHDLPTLRYIGKYLNDFKSTGKKIYAISDSYDQNQYYLASFANKIFLSPYGYVKLHGFSFKKFFIKDLLQKLKINTYIFRIGEYKSAVEPILRNNMSNNNKIILSKLINNIWCDYLTTITTNRKLTFKKIFPTNKDFLISLEKSHGDLALFALQNKLIDKISNNDEFEEEMIKTFGVGKEKTYNKIDINNYIKVNIEKSSIIKDNQSNISVITINGIMIYGKNNSNIITKAIHKVYKNPHIKGLILRINSPGGDIKAAQAIYDELILLKKVHKPIVVLMGKVAASGAYWISTAADFIIADPSSLTGSIGIFSIIYNFSDLLNRFGIQQDGVNISDRFNFSISEKISTIEKKIIELTIQNGYDKFISVVSKERNLPIENVKKIANGMIFLGKDAIKYGLIDDLGDFDYAKLKISELTKIKKIELQWENTDVLDISDFFLKINSYITSNIINNIFFINNIDFFNFQKTYALLFQ
ncbi:signal peptide peptidase SppA [Enterobacteriaceae endosymbiont of Donacia cincticornis]|uniref:signal peptide peptidase SppA n=1 Tax=Enterobacteriaceae endosymbiont of Donacia cincticornis TaxID=2675773 RepID=UPI001448FD34|nr:signal peptide peptidase SppA [Enterobacteriaceae endosymbiont of Donacia cincticornis]QJC35992.1 signal peptide peptidase SppA [Enterobacteriaceae endosymbiont of Donacia cincticornis]